MFNYSYEVEELVARVLSGHEGDLDSSPCSKADYGRDLKMGLLPLTDHTCTFFLLPFLPQSLVLSCFLGKVKFSEHALGIPGGLDPAAETGVGTMYLIIPSGLVLR